MQRYAIMNKSEHSFLENCLISSIKEQVGTTGVKRVKTRLLEKYGTTISQAIDDWDKISDILKEQFAGGSLKITNNYIKKISELNPFQTNFKKNIIDDSKVVKTIMNMLGDPDSCKIINYLMKNTSIIEDILKNNKIPSTSGYRKMDKMIATGMVIESGYVIAKNTGRKIPKYTTPFESLYVDIVNASMVVNFTPKKDVEAIRLRNQKNASSKYLNS